MSKYMLRHDEANCIGCLACEVHCKTNKDLGAGPDPCQVIALGPVDVDGHPRMRFVFMPCFHCEDPWCVRACPTGAMQQREKDGIVFVESALCIGCKSCIAACPWGTPQWDPATNKVVKCDYCKDRIDVGLQPACVTKCVTGCLSFGVANEVPDPRRERYARQLRRRAAGRQGGEVVTDLPVLPAWLDAGGAVLEGAVRAGSDARRRAARPQREPGRWRRCSGCNTCSRPGWPSAARRANPSLSRGVSSCAGHGPSTLVIDATGLDTRAQGSVTVLDRAPWLLAEGVLIAAGLRDSRTVELRLPAELAGHEAALLNAVDALRSLAHVDGAPRIHLDVQRDSRASCWGEGRPADGSRLVHTPETWCRLALLFAGAAGPEASLLTLRRGMNQRGLVELARSGNLRRPDRRLGRRRRRGRPATPCSSSTTASEGSCRCRRRTCRAIRCRSRRPASSRRRRR